MAYKYTKGSVNRGDIYNEDDTQGNTYLDWNEDALGVVAGGTTVFVVSGSTALVGIGTDSPDYTLDVAGDIGVDQYIYHNGDADTLISFADDKIVLKAGNLAGVTIEKKGSAPHEVTINDGANNIDFVVKGNGSNAGNPGMNFDASTNRLGINGVGSPSYELDVAGDIGLAEYIYHKGDDDTYIQFEDDTIIFAAGGRSFLKLEEASQDKLIINHGGLNIDLKVSGQNEPNLIRTDAANDKVGIGVGEPDHTLTVAGNISASINISASSFYGDGSNLSGISGGGGSPGGSDTQIQFNDSDSFAGESVFVWDKDDNMCGVGTSSPKVTLDVHHTGAADPTSLSNDTGGGEVVYFGTGSLTAGKLYYLNTDGGWAETDASVTGSGHNQLLGISLGSNPASNGMLTRGYFDMHTYYAGSFVKGGPAYISIEAAEVAGTAPTGSNEYLRIVGYGTDTANVLYFNPDSTYVELG